MIRTLARILVCLVLGGGMPVARAAAWHVIIAGKGGDPEFDQRFFDWAGRLERVLVDRLGQPNEHVFVLADRENGNLPSGWAVSDLAGIRGTFERLAGRIAAGDTLFIYLIGHGSYHVGESRLHIDGEDLTARDLLAMIEPLPARTVALVNAASASAGFINVFSGPGRIVCTATRSVEERNATEFMEHFLQGLEDQSADLDRDDRISLLEACRQGAQLTEAAYTAQGLLATEHAILDDNGDGLGTRLSQTVAERAPDAAERLDGDVAARCYLKDFSFPEGADPALIEAYRAAIGAVEDLKRRKATMDEAAYRSQLEALLIEAARINRRLHAGRPPAP